MKNRNRWFLSLLLIALVVLVSAATILLSRAPENSVSIKAVSDGVGGAIIAWQKEGIYIQHLSAAGQPLWEEGGIKVSEVSYASNPLNWQTSFTFIADGKGGAIITWDDKSQRSSDQNDPAYFDPIPFYSQRISANGEFLWKDTFIGYGGSMLAGDYFPVAVADDTGGAIFAWNNYKTYSKALHDNFLRLQKLAPDGTRLWGNDGVLLVSSSPYRPLTEEEKAAGIKGTVGRSWPSYTGSQDIVSNRDGGMLVIWEEREDNQGNSRVCAQRLDGTGNPIWNDRVMVWGAPYLGGSLHSDGSGGAILCVFRSKKSTVTEQSGHRLGRKWAASRAKWAAGKLPVNFA